MIGKEKILLLGGSYQQVPAIVKAKELGYITVVCDYLPDNPGRKVADKWYPVSTTDIDAVYDVAVRENVGGILPYASDPAALTAAVVADRLSLPTNPVEAVEILGTKHKFRHFLQENGFAYPDNYSFSKLTAIDIVKKNIKNFILPILIKPTDSSGSKGISLVSNVENLEKAIRYASTFSRNGILIAEEYIDKGFPYVIGGDIFIEDEKIALFGHMSCLRDKEGSGLIPVGKLYPDGLNSLQLSNLREELERLIRLLGIKSGEFNLEVIIDSDNKPHFLELGPRAGGNMIPIQLSDIFNVDLIEANILAAMGKKVNLHPAIPESCFMTYVLHSEKSGYFETVNIHRDIMPYLYRKSVYKNNGDFVEAFDGAGKAVGIVFFKFPSIEVMRNFSENIDKYIKVEIG